MGRQFMTKLNDAFYKSGPLFRMYILMKRDMGANYFSFVSNMWIYVQQ